MLTWDLLKLSFNSLVEKQRAKKEKQSKDLGAVVFHQELMQWMRLMGAVRFLNINFLLEIIKNPQLLWNV